jgi:hypothetical protein
MTKTIREALSDQDIKEELGDQYHIYMKIINQYSLADKPFTELNWNKVSKLINDHLWKQVNTPSPPPTPTLSRRHTAKGIRKKHRKSKQRKKTRRTKTRRTKTHRTKTRRKFRQKKKTRRQRLRGGWKGQIDKVYWWKKRRNQWTRTEGNNGWMLLEEKPTISDNTNCRNGFNINYTHHSNPRSISVCNTNKLGNNIFNYFNVSGSVEPNLSNLKSYELTSDSSPTTKQKGYSFPFLDATKKQHQFAVTVYSDGGEGIPARLTQMDEFLEGINKSASVPSEQSSPDTVMPEQIGEIEKEVVDSMTSEIALLSPPYERTDITVGKRSVMSQIGPSVPNPTNTNISYDIIHRDDNNPFYEIYNTTEINELLADNQKSLEQLKGEWKALPEGDKTKRQELAKTKLEGYMSNPELYTYTIQQK